MYPHIEAFTGIARRWAAVGHGERDCWWTQVVAYTGGGRSDARDERRWRLRWRLHKVELRQDGSLCTKMSQVLPRPVPDPDKDISPCSLHARHIHSPCSDRYRSAQSQGMTAPMTRRHMHLRLHQNVLLCSKHRCAHSLIPVRSPPSHIETGSDVPQHR